jgi:hypothetical protein
MTFCRLGAETSAYPTTVPIFLDFHLHMVAVMAAWEVMEAIMIMVWALAMAAMVTTVPIILLITPLWALVDSTYMDKSEESF